jgi:hypothetical protein
MIPSTVTRVRFEIPETRYSTVVDVTHPGWALVLPRDADRYTSYLCFTTAAGDVWERPFQLGPSLRQWLGSESEHPLGTGYGPTLS